MGEKETITSIMRNPFDIFRKNVDITQHKKNIEKGMSLVCNFLVNNSIEFNKKSIEKIFYDLFNNEVEYRFNRMNHKIAYLISRFIQVDILFSEKKITEKMLKIHNQWFNYLFTRINRLRENLSKNTIISFHIDFPMGYES